MSNILIPIDGANKRYDFQTRLADGVSVLSLFDSVRVEKHCTKSPEGDSPELWFNGLRFDGKSVYLTPCAELSQLIASCNIYGDPVYKDVYLRTLCNGSGRYGLAFTFQQIIGGYMLVELSQAQFDVLNDLYLLPVGTKR